MYCPSCGAENQDGNYCLECGLSLSPLKPSASKSRRIIEGVLRVIIGSIMTVVSIFLAVVILLFWGLYPAGSMISFASMFVACGGMYIVFPQHKRIILLTITALAIIICIIYAVIAIFVFTSYDRWWILHGIMLLFVAGGIVAVGLNTIKSQRYNYLYKSGIITTIVATLGVTCFIYIVFLDSCSHFNENYNGWEGEVWYKGDCEIDDIRLSLENNGYIVTGNSWWKRETSCCWMQELIDRDNEEIDYIKSVEMRAKNSNQYYIHLQYWNHSKDYISRKKGEQWIKGEADNIMEILEREKGIKPYDIDFTEEFYYMPWS